VKGEKAKELAAEMLNTSKKRVWINPEEEEALKEAITKDDLREMIKQRIIKKSKLPAQSRVRARKLKEKKQRGRKHGPGRKKTSKKKRTEKKASWIGRVRAQRRTLKELQKEKPEEVEKIGYGNLYRKIKGNYFKGKRYLENYVSEGAKK